MRDNVLKLITKANRALKTHKFYRAKDICSKALKIEPDNPHIHTILLLATYKVTEIKELQNCQVDYNSDIYWNVRRFATNDIKIELDKYLPYKGTYEITKSSVDNSESSKEIITQTTELANYNSDKAQTEKDESEQIYAEASLKEDQNENKSSFFRFLKKDYDKTKSDFSNFFKFLTKKYCLTSILSSIKKLPFIIIDFYTDKKHYSKSGWITQAKDPFWEGTKKEDPAAETTTFISIILLSPMLIGMFLLLLSVLSDKKYMSFLGIFLVDILFLLILKKNYRRIIVWKSIKKPNKTLYFFRSTINSFLSVVSFIATYALYFHSIKFLDVTDDYFLGLFLGFLSSLAVNYYYVQLYSFIKNLNALYLIFTKKTDNIN